MDDFIQDYCNRGSDYCNTEERLNSTLNTIETNGAVQPMGKVREWMKNY